MTSRWLGRLLLIVGLSLVGRALWMPLKAALAQELLQRAYEQAPGQARPWPWADFSAVAVLRMPRLEVQQLVLDQASPRALAFGPGLQSGMVDPGGHGRVVLAGHRDSHFGWLRELIVGDALWLDTPSGALRYRVVETRVVDSRSTRIARQPDGDDELLLTTCWPFDALLSGGPMRYAVRARRAG